MEIKKKVIKKGYTRITANFILMKVISVHAGNIFKLISLCVSRVLRFDLFISICCEEKTKRRRKNCDK